MISLRLPSRMINRDRTDIRLLGQEHNQGRGLPIHRLLRVITPQAHRQPPNDQIDSARLAAFRAEMGEERRSTRSEWTGRSPVPSQRWCGGERVTSQGLASGPAAWRYGGRTGSVPSPA